MQRWDLDLVQIVNASPSLTKLSFSVEENPSKGQFSPNVIEQLGALDRQLTLNVDWEGSPDNTARRDQLCHQFPRLKVVLVTQRTRLKSHQLGIH